MTTLNMNTAGTSDLNATPMLEVSGVQIGRASCRERV